MSGRQWSEHGLRRLNWSVLAVSMLLGWGSTLLVLVIGRDDYSDWGSGNVLSDLSFALMVSLFPVVGFLILNQQPRNRIGWLLQSIGLAWTLPLALDWYTQVGLVWRPGSLPAADAVEVVGSAMWVPPILLMGFYLILLFPDGHAPGPRWRALAWAAGGLGGLIFAAIVLGPGPVDEVRVPLASNPLGVEALEPIYGFFFIMMLPALPLCFLAAAVSAVLRFRRAGGVSRLQLKWLMTAGSIVAVLFGLAMIISSLTQFRTSAGADGPFLSVVQTVSINSFGLIPIAIGIAITRHNLYDIDARDQPSARDRLAGRLRHHDVRRRRGRCRHRSSGRPSLRSGSPSWPPRSWPCCSSPCASTCTGWRTGWSTAPGPRRTRCSRTSRGSMAGRYTTRELLPRMAQTVSECLGGARVEVWLGSGEQMVRDVVWPVESEPVESKAGEAVSTTVGGSPSARVVPVRHGEELLGQLVVTKPPSEPVTPLEDEMLEHVASQAGLVLRNRRLVDDLRGSRQRLVTSQDVERRRLERNLHDGAQQSLVSVALLLRMAADSLDPEVLAATVEEASAQLQQAITELRELARGIHPAILTDRGLGPALTSLAERCPVPVVVDNEVRRRLPGPVEGALYFVVAEALTNVARYARAPRADVTLVDEGREVTLEVVDHGVGGADLGSGSGLLGLADRVAVVDGTFAVHSPPGGGTRIVVRVPVPEPAPQPAPGSASGSLFAPAGAVS